MSAEIFRLPETTFGLHLLKNFIREYGGLIMPDGSHASEIDWDQFGHILIEGHLRAAHNANAPEDQQIEDPYAI